MSVVDFHILEMNAVQMPLSCMLNKLRYVNPTEERVNYSYHNSK